MYRISLNGRRMTRAASFVAACRKAVAAVEATGRNNAVAIVTRDAKSVIERTRTLAVATVHGLRAA